MDERVSISEIIGKGVYTTADVFRLTHIPASRVSRWLHGRRRLYAGDYVYDAPLWTPDLPDIDGTLHLTFRDLIEVRMVDAFRRQGLSLPYIRQVVRAAQELLQTSHPFTSHRFKTDGRRLYFEVVQKTKEPKLIEVLNGQHAFHSIMAVGLKDIVFENGEAALWAPTTGRGDIVLDPLRSFGQPITRTAGIPTSALKLQASAGRTAKQLATDFEVSEREVISALAFEEQLAA